MNFQNFYISIFKNKKINSKRFTLLFIVIMIFIFIVSVFLKYIDINMNSNDLIKNYQLSKINNLNTRIVDTIIVGDSSAGNAIDAKLFTELSGKKTLNLSLTGSWGILGSLGIIKKSIKKIQILKI